MGYYIALTYVGVEMVVPMLVGIGLDYWLDWTPWATITGLILGFVGGLIHLVRMVQQHDAQERRPPPGEGPR
jgi:F0F1-type ATP synthase assembly protein I